MKIVFLIDYFQPKLGYQEFFLAREMQKLGHQIFVITSNYYFPFPDYQNTVQNILGKRERKVGRFIEEGIDVYRLPLIFQAANGAVTIFKDLKKTIIKIKPDIVYADGVFSPIAYQIARDKKKFNYKLFYDNHASSFNTNLSNSLLKKSYMFLFKTFLVPIIEKAADGYTAVGESERQLLVKEYGLKLNRVKIIPLGADSSIFYPDKKKRIDFRKELKVTNNEILLVYAGKITERKDLDILFKASYLVLKRYYNLKLLVISGGEKDLINKLKTYSKGHQFARNVIWKEPVENNRLSNYYNAADLGVWPGDLSNTIIEAMACGLPVILPDKISLGQTSHHLLKNNNGLAFKRYNEIDLAKKIMTLIKNKNFRINMGEKSVELVKRELNWASVAQRFLNLYEKN